jgi:hypothetical protein
MGLPKLEGPMTHLGRSLAPAEQGSGACLAIQCGWVWGSVDLEGMVSLDFAPVKGRDSDLPGKVHRGLTHKYPHWGEGCAGTNSSVGP